VKRDKNWMLSLLIFSFARDFMSCICSLLFMAASMLDVSSFPWFAKAILAVCICVSVSETQDCAIGSVHHGERERERERETERERERECVCVCVCE
jgi:hypothetical protein